MDITIIEIVATLAAGTFFGAAIYINLAQHPATMAMGGEFAGKFFPPMYKRASTMQIALAVAGTLAGIAVWFVKDQTIWLVGALCLISVVPITLMFIKPINDQLLDESKSLSSTETTELLGKWNPRHWLRSEMSGLSFLLYLIGLSS